MVRTSNITGTQETAGKDQKPGALNPRDGIEKALGERAPVSSGSNTLKSDPNLTAAQTKSSGLSPRFAGIDMGESTAAAEGPAESIAPAGRTLSFMTGKHNKHFQPTGSNSRSGGAHVQELNITGLQAKNQGNSAPDDGSNLNRELMLPNPHAQSSPTEGLSDTSVQSAKSESDTSAGTFPGIKEQLFESIRSSLSQDEQRLTIRLHPPELGKVSVRVQEQQGQITGVLEVSKAETRYEIEHALPAVIKALQDAGVQIRRLEVVLTDQPEQQLFKDQSLQYGSFQQNLSSEGNYLGNGPSEEWPAHDNGYQDMSEPQLFIAEGSINMLV
ncbi:MAG: flagellar hook-length control protein FliK [Planctomycetota bacterium]